MSKAQIKQLIERKAFDENVIETGVDGVKLFKVTEAVQCSPVVYEPSIVAIVGGSKDAILNGKHHQYGPDQYLCCTLTLPVEAGTSAASPEDPLLGVYISLDTQLMTEIIIEIENNAAVLNAPIPSDDDQGVTLSQWDEGFTEALLRLIELSDKPLDSAILGKARLRELYYAVLKGEAGTLVRSSFAVGNKIARSIDYLSSRFDEKVTIDQMAADLGMSRAVFHRKFKQATNMSPIQFVKLMRLNSAAVKIAEGISVNEAAMAVGYISSSQFSREFKRAYGQSPRHWANEHGRAL